MPFFGAVAGYIVDLLGGADRLLMAMIWAMVLDYCLGVVHAWTRRDLSSAVMASALWRKLLTFVAVAVANLADQALSQGSGIRSLICGYITLKELLSCTEHLAGLGVPMPEWFVSRLRVGGNMSGTTGRSGSDSSER